MSENAFAHSSTWWMENEQISPCEKQILQVNTAWTGGQVHQLAVPNLDWHLEACYSWLRSCWLAVQLQRNWRSISSISCRIWGKKAQSILLTMMFSSPKKPAPRDQFNYPRRNLTQSFGHFSHPKNHRPNLVVLHWSTRVKHCKVHRCGSKTCHHSQDRQNTLLRRIWKLPHWLESLRRSEEAAGLDNKYYRTTNYAQMESYAIIRTIWTMEKILKLLRWHKRTRWGFPVSAIGDQSDPVKLSWTSHRVPSHHSHGLKPRECK